MTATPTSDTFTDLADLVDVVDVVGVTDLTGLTDLEPGRTRSRSWPPETPDDGRAPRRARPARTPSDNVMLLLVVGGFFAVAIVVWAVVWWSYLHPPAVVPVQAPLPDLARVPVPWRGWVHYDAIWYQTVSRDGYTFTPGAPSSVAFFPGYPLLIRLLTAVVPADGLVVGSALTLAAGATSIGLLWRWCRLRMDAAGAALTAALFAVYPYSIYLYGPVYADALFVAGTLASFVLLEEEHLVAATIVAAATSATRPLGLVVAACVVLRLIERRRSTPGSRRDLLVLGAGGGFLAYCGYLGVRFGDPLAFATVQGASGWDQAPGPHTWFKEAFIHQVSTDPTGPAALGLLLQLACGLLALSSVPFVRRRFGLAYAALVTLTVLFAFVGTKDFHGTGRYVLPAFPAIALLGDRLASRRVVRVLLPAMLLPVLLLFASWFAKGNYLA